MSFFKTLGVYASTVTWAMWGWLALSAMSLLIWSPESFQRLGSFGVAVVVIGIGTTLRNISEWENRLKLARATKYDDSIHSLFLGLEFTTKAAKDEITQENLWEILRELSNNSVDLFKTHSLEMNSLETEVEEMKSSNLKLELVVLSVATIQWGYGEIFHKWVHNALL